MEMKEAILSYTETWRMQNSPNRQAIVDEAEPLAKFLERAAYSLVKENYAADMEALENKVADLEKQLANKGRKNVDRS